MENAFGSNVVSPVAGVVFADPNSIACQGFRRAVTKWCKDGKGNRDGSFNDYMFRELKSKDPPPIPGGAADQMKREVPMLADATTMKSLADRAADASGRAKSIPTNANVARAQQHADIEDNVGSLTKQFESGLRRTPLIVEGSTGKCGSRVTTKCVTQTRCSRDTL